MTLEDVPALREMVEPAVRPLTEHGDFYLTGVTHEEMYGDVDVLLTSKEFNIRFHTILKVPGTFSCFFTVNTVNRTFDAGTFFRALDIDIPMRPGNREPLSGLEKFRYLFKNRRAVNAALLERSGFIPEIHRLSGDIIRVLPLLDDLFISQNINATWDSYLAEARKKR